MKNGPYILVRAPKEYPGKKYRQLYVYEHHLVWWRNTNICVPEGYQIHHRNEDKTDNSFENLEMVFKNTHAKIHNGKKPKGITLLICSWCKSAFSLETRNYKFRKNNGQIDFHCSRSCQVHTQQQKIHNKKPF